MTEEELILKNTNLIYAVIKKLKLYHRLDEFYDVGMIGLVKGAKKYDSSLGYTPSTYLYRCIYNEILMSIRRINSGREIPEYKMASLSTEIGENITLGDTIQDEKDFEEEIIKKEQITILYKELSNLTEQEQLIINLTFGVNGYQKTRQKDICEILNLSQPQVSRIKDRALNKLRKVMKWRKYMNAAYVTKY